MMHIIVLKLALASSLMLPLEKTLAPGLNVHHLHLWKIKAHLIVAKDSK